MLRLPDAPLNAKPAELLARWQAEVSCHGRFDERLEAATRLWKRQHNSVTLGRVRRALRALANDRCAYCENPDGDTLDHYRPRSSYPELAFVWLNYVPACERCNNAAKGHRFPLWVEAAGSVCETTAGMAPPEGAPLLVNPRTEGALELLELDLRDTFLLLVRDGLDKYQTQRALTTLDVLRLNRPDVVTARARAYQVYCARLKAGIPVAPLEHPTVWAEMKRQRALIPELQALFDQAPAALDW